MRAVAVVLLVLVAACGNDEPKVMDEDALISVLSFRYDDVPKEEIAERARVARGICLIEDDAVLVQTLIAAQAQDDNAVGDVQWACDERFDAIADKVYGD